MKTKLAYCETLRNFKNCEFRVKIGCEFTSLNWRALIGWTATSVKNNCGEVLTQSWKKNQSRRKIVKRQFWRNAGFARFGRVDGVQSVQQKGERRSFDFRGARFEFENEKNALCVVEILGCLVNLSDNFWIYYRFQMAKRSEAKSV